MADQRILVGVIERPHGVKGLVRVRSYTVDPKALTRYGPLEDERGRHYVLRWQAEGIAAVSELADGQERPIEDRAAAAWLTGTGLYAERALLPEPAAEEFYVADLIGLAAEDTSGHPLGIVVAVHDAGAGASLEIRGLAAHPLLVPFSRTAVPLLDSARGCVVIDPPTVIEVSP